MHWIYWHLKLRRIILRDCEKVISHACNLLSPQCFVLVKPEQTETRDQVWLRFYLGLAIGPEQRSVLS